LWSAEFRGHGFQPQVRVAEEHTRVPMAADERGMVRGSPFFVTGMCSVRLSTLKSDLRRTCQLSPRLRIVAIAETSRCDTFVTARSAMDFSGAFADT
jgi:hypothetical protein